MDCGIHPGKEGV